MTTAQNLRYQLPKKSIKSDCPQCGPKHRRTLSRYVDTRTGEPLPDGLGRCDREANCSYHVSPYHKSPSGLSYADEVYKQWKADNHLPTRSTPPQNEQHKPNTARPDANNAPSKSELVYVLPDEVFSPSLGNYENNQLARLLCQQFGQSKADELLKRFRIGTSVRWPGACVFWLIDEQERPRAGQLVLFADDWHKARYTDHKGETKVCIDSVSFGLLRRYSKAQQPAPDWLTDYHENAPRWPILFGLHQLADAPVDMPVAIVEAPKTAVVCSALIPGLIWLAAGALSYLNTERLDPLRNRAVLLCPDLSTDGKAFAKWQKVADEMNAGGCRITISDLLERNATNEQRSAGLDLADFLLQQQPETDTPAPASLRGIMFDVERMTRLFWQDWPAPPRTWNSIRTHKLVQLYALIAEGNTETGTAYKPNLPEKTATKPQIQSIIFHP